MVDIKRFLLGSKSLPLLTVCSLVLEKCIEYVGDQTFFHVNIDKIEASIKFVFYSTSQTVSY